MNAKKFLVSGIVGGIVSYLLGWLLYGIVFKDQFPVKEGEVMNMFMIAHGSLVTGLFIAFIFTKWANISNWKSGLKAGAVLGLFLALYYNSFANAMNANTDIDCQMIGLDIALSIIMGAITGAVIAVVLEKMK